MLNKKMENDKPLQKYTLTNISTHFKSFFVVQVNKLIQPL